MNEKIPEKKHWRMNWSERDVKKLEETALYFRAKGARDMLTAWRAAEQTYLEQYRHNLRRVPGSGTQR